MNMSNNIDAIIAQLRELGLSREQSRLYIELLREPSTHLRLAHATGINRTKVYRLASDLEKRSLVSRRTDDRGTFLVAADPATLEVELVSREESIKSQRSAFEQVLPTLKQIKTNEASGFIVHTYEGVEGFKQMLWHELKTTGINRIFGSGTIEDLVPDSRWAEKHRAETVLADYTIHELLNPGDKGYPFTHNTAFMDRYLHRRIPRDILTLTNQTVIHDSTVSTYHWRNGQKVGYEIINEEYAQMMRQMFDHYWDLCTSD
jgi:sugar-specific transcriptional regulator TrmB